MRGEKKGLIFSFFIWVSLTIACDGGNVPLNKPVIPAKPGKSTTEYGKFVVYHVGDNKIKTLGTGSENNQHNLIDYRITELPYFPEIGVGNTVNIYNRLYRGDGYKYDGTIATEQNIFYRDRYFLQGIQTGAGADYPEAIVDGGVLYFYYLNPVYYQMENNACLAADGGMLALWNESADWPDNMAEAVEVDSSVFNCWAYVVMESLSDVDFMKLKVSEYTPLLLSILNHRVNRNPTETRCDIEVELYETDPSNLKITKVNESRNSLDYFYNNDQQLVYLLKPNLDYYFKFYIPEGGKCPQNTLYFWLYGAPVQPLPPLADQRSKIYRARIMPARSGNPDLYGGPTFEPDDLSTPVEDNFPDCDGIPDTGDEGDWGIYEETFVCHSGEGTVFANHETGLKDGVMEYWEVDNPNSIDDGEYFAGEETNLWATGEEAPTVIKMGNEYWMWISAGPGIFLLKSKDGLNWDMSNIKNGKPSLLARRFSALELGDQDAPVISSGRYGYCESKALGDDVEEAVVEKRGEFEVYRGHPGTVGITYGGNGILESYPMVDTEENGTITTGPDGVLNTFYFPKCVHYSPPLFKVEVSVATEGPGNPDKSCSGEMVDLENQTTVSVLGSDTTAYLLGDDEWAVDSFGINPVEYWRKQRCNLLALGEEFDRCALGKPHTRLALSGTDGILNTVEEHLGRDDYLCHKGERVNICAGANRNFDGEPIRADMLTSLKDDDILCVKQGMGYEVISFAESDPYVLAYPDIVPGTEKLVSFAQIVNILGGTTTGPAEVPPNNYIIDYDSGIITNNGWDPTDYIIVAYQYNSPVIAICPGPDNELDTPVFDYGIFVTMDGGMDARGVLQPINIPIPYAVDTYCGDLVFDSIEMKFVCTTNDCAICPGSDGRLDSLKDIYYLDTSLYSWQPQTGNLAPVLIPKYDIYDRFDDRLVTLDGVLALDPGNNGYFQEYRLHSKEEIEHYDNVDTLIETFEPPRGDCYDLETVKVWDEFYQTEKEEYSLYRYKGLMGDDEIIWDENSGQYIVLTGQNGINQSCIPESDIKLLPRHQGLPNQVVIRAGADGILQSYAMKDELIVFKRENARDILKVGTGPDGIMNTFAIGDDRVEILFGMGAADYPCIVAGPDGIAQSIAGGNDRQLYRPGEKTGFDSFRVGTPEAVKEGDTVYLFYTGLGWQTVSECMPSSAGALGDMGECKRPGLDNRWGNLEANYDPFYLDPAKLPMPFRLRSFITIEGKMNYAVFYALDDNPGVMIAPRIGVAYARVSELMIDPGAFMRKQEPIIDIGKLGPTSLDIGGQISLGGISLAGVLPPEFNYYGSFAPEVIVSYEPSNDKPIFLMFFNGIYSKENRPVQGVVTEKDKRNIIHYQVGVARSVEPLQHWDLLVDMNPLIISGDFATDLNEILAGGEGKEDGYLHPTVFEGGEGTIAEKTYAMIYKRMFKMGEQTLRVASYDDGYGADREWLGFAVRKGNVYAGLLSCELSRQSKSNERNFRIVESLILLFPLGLILSLRVWKKAKKFKSLEEKMIRRGGWLFLVFLGLIVFKDAYAQSLLVDNRSRMFGVSSRGAAMGGAMVAIADGVDSLTYNPGALALSKNTLSFELQSYVNSKLMVNEDNYAPSGVTGLFGITHRFFRDRIGLGLLLNTSMSGLDLGGLLGGGGGGWTAYSSGSLPVGYGLAIRVHDTLGVGLIPVTDTWIRTSEIKADLSSLLQGLLGVSLGSPATDVNPNIGFATSTEEVGLGYGIAFRPIKYLSLGYVSLPSSHLRARIPITIGGGGLIDDMRMVMNMDLSHTPAVESYGIGIHIPIVCDKLTLAFSQQNIKYGDLYDELYSDYLKYSEPELTEVIQISYSAPTPMNDITINRYGFEYLLSLKGKVPDSLSKRNPVLAIRAGYFHWDTPYPEEKVLGDYYELRGSNFDADADVYSGGIGFSFERVNKKNIVEPRRKSRFSFDLHYQFFDIEDKDYLLTYDEFGEPSSGGPFYYYHTVAEIHVIGVQFSWLY